MHPLWLRMGLGAYCLCMRPRDSSMSDYTLHGNKQRRANYLSRHRHDTSTGDPTRAGYLSKEILWGGSTSLKANIAAYKRKHHF
jgi:hypothetical protein